MNWHLLPGQLHTGSKEVWGCPRFSSVGCGWLIDYYAANGQVQGIIPATYDEQLWIKANPEAVRDMQDQIIEWTKELDCVISNRKNIL